MFSSMYYPTYTRGGIIDEDINDPGVIAAAYNAHIVSLIRSKFLAESYKFVAENGNFGPGILLSKFSQEILGKRLSFLAFFLGET